MIANIIPFKRTSIEKSYFSYLVPAELEGKVSVGSMVYIPFGKNKIRGVVLDVKLEQISSDKFKIKPIISLDESFNLPLPYIKVAKWLSAYYLCSLGEAVNLFIPLEVKCKPKDLEQELPRLEGIPKQLSANQESVFRRLKALLEHPDKPALIHGVTSSGKTEIYLKLAAEVLAQGKQVIVLVPEIMLTPQTISKFKEVFGSRVGVIHSGLSKSEKVINYHNFYSGMSSILIGPRSALLVPSQKLGLIIIDEEGESSYKQEKNPKYHAVRLAEEIARETNALLVMGSATPTIESYYKCQTGQYELLELNERYGSREMPTATLVDLRDEIKNKNFSPISEKLKEAIARTLADKGQIFLFLNRRGTSTFISCRECGTVILCPECSIPLVYHVDLGRTYLSCHHCDYETTVPYRCPACQGYKIKYFGAGIEKIESEIQSLFPAARVRRIDSSSLNSKADYHNLYEELRDSKLDILIGTQIIAKGLDIPAVDLVGVVSADVGLHLPYFKAEEKTFQILTQVSGRSGRRQKIGRTIIQTYWPEARAIIAASRHDYKSFFADEVENRKQFNDPPFSHLVRVVSEDKDQTKAKSFVEEIAAKARALGLEHLGPAKAFYSRLRGKHRYHLIIKVKALPDKSLNELFKINPYLFWDVEPENLL